MSQALTLNSKTITYEQLAKTIDHSLLRPELTEADVIAGCELANHYHVASVCVKPCHVKLAKKWLANSDVAVGTVVGFPHGNSTIATKVFETQEAVAAGATEIDMVINIGALKARDLDLVARDIRGVVAASHERGAIVKVIIEAALLTDEEKTISCLLSKEAGADFVKTSTGFASGGATVHDVALMRKAVGPEMGVKAAGGVRTYEDAESMIKAGATRIGASAGVKILQGPSKEPAPAAPVPAAAKSY